MKHIERLTNKTARMMKDENGWCARHIIAIMRPKAQEMGFVSMLKGWLQFADNHTYNYADGIGSDYYTGDIWARVGVELRGLLSCDIGTRLDCGTLDGVILSALEAEGFDESGERPE